MLAFHPIDRRRNALGDMVVTLNVIRAWGRCGGILHFGELRYSPRRYGITRQVCRAGTTHASSKMAPRDLPRPHRRACLELASTIQKPLNSAFKAFIVLQQSLLKLQGPLKVNQNSGHYSDTVRALPSVQNHGRRWRYATERLGPFP
jgi:hypothetical protein